MLVLIAHIFISIRSELAVVTQGGSYFVSYVLGAGTIREKKKVKSKLL